MFKKIKSILIIKYNKYIIDLWHCKKGYGSLVIGWRCNLCQQTTYHTYICPNNKWKIYFKFILVKS